MGYGDGWGDIRKLVFNGRWGVHSRELRSTYAKGLTVDFSLVSSNRT